MVRLARIRRLYQHLIEKKDSVQLEALFAKRPSRRLTKQEVIEEFKPMFGEDELSELQDDFEYVVNVEGKILSLQQVEKEQAKAEKLDLLPNKHEILEGNKATSMNDLMKSFDKPLPTKKKKKEKEGEVI